MAHQRNLEVLKQGVKVWNEWYSKTKEADFSTSDLRGADLSDADFCNTNFYKANLSKSQLRGANLRGADLRGADLTDADLSGADLWKAKLCNADICGAKLKNVNLNGADLFRANFSKADLQGAVFHHAHFTEANFNGADLRGADLSRCELRGASNLKTANLSQVNLFKANLHKAINLSKVNLSGAKLNGANLSEANLRNTILSGADLRGADLRSTDFGAAYLIEADLSGANLRGANLSGANLSGANLTRVVLVDVNIEQTILKGCQIYGLAAWNINGKPREQSNLVITRPDEPTITVDDIQVAQLIYLLLNNKNVRNVIDTVTSKAVLILGRFTNERKAVLDMISNALRMRNYLPIVFDFNGPQSRDITETVSTLAHMAKFIVADITDAKSIPQELMAIVPNLPSVPVQPLLLKSQREYGMFEHFKHYHWVLETYYYSDPDSLINSIQERLVLPAENWLTINKRK